MKTDLLNAKNFNRTQSELEDFLLHCIFVAGKKAKTQAEKLAQFYFLIGSPEYPIQELSNFSLEDIFDNLVLAKAGANIFI